MPAFFSLEGTVVLAAGAVVDGNRPSAVQVMIAETGEVLRTIDGN
jgi:hypothetical protein